MKICIVTKDYPDAYRSTHEFVKQVVVAWADMGHQCVVVAPFARNENRGINHQFYEEQVTACGNKIEVFRPAYINNEDTSILGFNLFYLLHGIAVNRGLKKIPFKPDVIYCHFWGNALESYFYAKHHKTPLFVASGEAVVSGLYSKRVFKGFRNYIKGVICVSSDVKQKCMNYGLVNNTNSIVLPNAYNPSLFFKTSKEEARQRLGIPQDAFIVSFVGSFCDRKGCMRLAEAIESIKEESVSSIFIGKGENDPSCSNILYKGQTKHEEINDYLNASDIFVLPTRNEGCCNATIEAMACGLPIISSRLPFNYDILDDTNSIMVDPDDIQEIANSIIRLKRDPVFRSVLSQGSLEKAKSLTIDKRASDIMDFIQKKLS